MMITALETLPLMIQIIKNNENKGMMNMEVRTQLKVGNEAYKKLRLGENIIGFQTTRIPCPHCRIVVTLALPPNNVDYESYSKELEKEIEKLMRKYSELYMEKKDILAKMKEKIKKNNEKFIRDL